MDILLGKIEGRSRKGQQKMRWLNSITYSMDMNLSKLWEIVKDREPGVLQSMGSQRVRHDLATEQQHLLKKCVWNQTVLSSDSIVH